MQLYSYGENVFNLKVFQCFDDIIKVAEAVHFFYSVPFDNNLKKLCLPLLDNMDTKKLLLWFYQLYVVKPKNQKFDSFDHVYVSIKKTTCFERFSWFTKKNIFDTIGHNIFCLNLRNMGSEVLYLRFWKVNWEIVNKSLKTSAICFNLKILPIGVPPGSVFYYTSILFAQHFWVFQAFTFSKIIQPLLIWMIMRRH